MNIYSIAFYQKKKKNNSDFNTMISDPTTYIFVDVRQQNCKLEFTELLFLGTQILLQSITAEILVYSSWWNICNTAV